MFDIAPSELLVVVLVAIVVIGPKDLPIALRTAGRWIGKMRRMSAHFRSGVEAMIREAELEEMEKKWREQNAAIMAQSGTTAAATPVTPADVADPGDEGVVLPRGPIDVSFEQVDTAEAMREIIRWKPLLPREGPDPTRWLPPD